MNEYEMLQENQLFRIRALEENKPNFSDDIHKFFFYTCMDIEDMIASDVERVSLFYILGLCSTTRDNIRKIYDFEKGQIILEAPSAAFQTGTSRALTILAFNLYNNFNLEDTTILDVFCSLDRDMIPFVFEGIMLRLEMLKVSQSVSNV